MNMLHTTHIPLNQNTKVNPDIAPALRTGIRPNTFKHPLAEIYEGF